MSLRTWLAGRGSNASVIIDDQEFSDLDCVAPYQAPILDEVLGRDGVAARQIPTFDAATGLDKVRFLVPAEDLEKSLEILRQFRQKG